MSRIRTDLIGRTPEGSRRKELRAAAEGESKSIQIDRETSSALRYEESIIELFRPGKRCE